MALNPPRHSGEGRNPGPIPLPPAVFLAGLAGVLALEGVTFLVPRSPEVAVHMAVLGAVRLAQASWILAVAWRLSREEFPFGLARSQWLRGLTRGALWCLAFGLLAGVGMLALGLLGQDPTRMLHSRLPESPAGLLLFVSVGTLLAPLAEEFFFRGLVYGYFRRWGVAAALLVSTVVFVLPHLPGARVPLTQAVGGVVFALAYEKEKNLLVPILIHATGNLALFAISWVGRS